MPTEMRWSLGPVVTDPGSGQRQQLVRDQHLQEIALVSLDVRDGPRHAALIAAAPRLYRALRTIVVVADVALPREVEATVRAVIFRELALSGLGALDWPTEHREDPETEEAE